MPIWLICAGDLGCLHGWQTPVLSSAFRRVLSLLLYYVGHGVLSDRGELCLAVTSTRPDLPTITGLRWETVCRDAAELPGSYPSGRPGLLFRRAAH
jgi:hypothetical protein